MLTQYILEIAGNSVVDIKQYKEKFRKEYKNMLNTNFEDKWNFTIQLLEQVQACPKPAYTKLVSVRTSYEHRHEFSISPIKHNPELLTLMLAIAKIWGNDINVEKRRTHTFHTLVKSITEIDKKGRVPDALSKYYESLWANQSYFYWTISREEVDKWGSGLFWTKIYVLRVLIY